MYIEKVDWILVNAKEAILTLENESQNKLHCFSQPCDYSVGDKFEETLYAFDVNNIAKVYSNCKERIELQRDGLSHHIIARVIDLKNSIVMSNGFRIELENMPNDIYEGELIEFTCSRIDSY